MRNVKVPTPALPDRFRPLPPLHLFGPVPSDLGVSGRLTLDQAAQQGGWGGGGPWGRGPPLPK